MEEGQGKKKSPRQLKVIHDTPTTFEESHDKPIKRKSLSQKIQSFINPHQTEVSEKKENGIRTFDEKPEQNSLQRKNSKEQGNLDGFQTPTSSKRKSISQKFTDLFMPETEKRKSLRQQLSDKNLQNQLKHESLGKKDSESSVHEARSRKSFSQKFIELFSGAKIEGGYDGETSIKTPKVKPQVQDITLSDVLSMSENVSRIINSSKLSIVAKDIPRLAPKIIQEDSFSPGITNRITQVLLELSKGVSPEFIENSEKFQKDFDEKVKDEDTKSFEIFLEEVFGPNHNIMLICKSLTQDALAHPIILLKKTSVMKHQLHFKDKTWKFDLKRDEKQYIVTHYRQERVLTKLEGKNVEFYSVQWSLEIGFEFQEDGKLRLNTVLMSFVSIDDFDKELVVNFSTAPTEEEVTKIWKDETFCYFKDKIYFDL
jgi:hypothetical protein